MRAETVFGRSGPVRQIRRREGADSGPLAVCVREFREMGETQTCVQEPGRVGECKVVLAYRLVRPGGGERAACTAGKVDRCLEGGEEGLIS